MAQTRILVVDDDSLIRMDLRDMLERMGYLVAGEAGDGQSAINAARTLRPDLVIMDIRMDGGPDGIAAAGILNADQIGPILLVTGFSDVELVRRATQAGVAGYILKPFSEGELHAAIEVTLARFHERQDLQREAHDLREELETRKLVERAKGVLMHELKLSEVEAYNRIQKASMNARKPMREVAEAILLSKQISG